MKLLFVGLSLLLAVGLSANAQVPAVYDAFSGFSSASNPTPDGVWSYGYALDLQGTLNLYTMLDTDFALSIWERPGARDPNIIKNETGAEIVVYGEILFPTAAFLHFHPGPNGEFSVARWTAPTSGQYRLEATFRSLRTAVPNTTSDVHILKRSVPQPLPIFSGLINSNQDVLDFSAVIQVNAGESVDFDVGIGSNSSYRFDSTGIRAMLTLLEPPETQITEFPVPSLGAGPIRITAGPDGNLWFTEINPGSPGIGRITPEGVITEFTIPTSSSRPLQITTGPDGNLWFTESASSANRIGRVTPSGSFAEFPIPTPGSNADGIATGPDGALWFTEYARNKIGRITTSGEITEFVVPTSNAVLEAIVAGPDGALWFVERRANKIGRITTSGEITEFPVSTPNSEPIFIAAGPDGALWFGESSANKIGRITTSGEITEFSIPTPGSEPYDIVAGLDGNLYFAEWRGNKIGRITTSGTITEFPIATPDSLPQGIASGPDGAIWFAEYGGGKIGRLSIEPPAVNPRLPISPAQPPHPPISLPPRG